MNEIEQIAQQIQQDPANSTYTSQGWKPIFQAPPEARLVIVGQAPGARAQASGHCFDDLSGDRLREWLGVSKEDFYQSGQIAVLPLDFYFPGKGKTGDLAPRKGFAEKWHPLILEQLNDVELIILAGAHAQAHYLGKRRYQTLTQTVQHYQEYLPTFFPIPHPSPLNGRWLKKNTWFEKDVIPDLREYVQRLMNR